MTPRENRYLSRKKKQRLTWTLYDCKKWIRSEDGLHDIAIGEVQKDNTRPVWIREVSKQKQPIGI